VIAAWPSAPSEARLAPWQSLLVDASEVLEAVPRGRLNVDALLTLHRLLLPVTNPHRGRLRSESGSIWLNGSQVARLPSPRLARRMLARTVKEVNQMVLRSDDWADPVAQSSDVVFHLLEAHAFSDGNGRLARAIGNWLLVGSGFQAVADPGDFCREQEAAQYLAIALRKGSPPLARDLRPWKEFFTCLVSACYEPKAACASTSTERINRS
jgi:fido (protein-threonine AMPylation protein)